MMHHLEGTLDSKPAGRLVIDVSGVGYEVLVSNGTWLDAGIPGSRVRILTHVHVQAREGQWTLFGFAHEEEREMFRLLLDVQGVGPRVALAILSGLPLARLKRAIAGGDIGSLTSVSGVGKKMAQRMVVDLKERVGGGAVEESALAPPDDEADDAVDALVALGYSRLVAREAVRGTRAGCADLHVEDVVREALRRL
jgi:holliday junction DNA helicase RuvA